MMQKNSPRDPKISHLILKPQRGWVSFDLADLWHYRDLLLLLTWRDIKIRYTQTILGIAWAMLQPLLTMVVFSVIFGQLAKLPSDGIPYPIFTYTALLPWQLFSYSLTNSINSLVGNQNLISKVYFPRLVIPIASVLPSLVDFAFSFLVLIGLMFYYRVPLTLHMLNLPLFLLLAMITALACGLWLSALNVQYRDIRHVVPFMVLLWQYATPVAYSSSLIPEKWRLLYSLNPMTGVVEGFRWALLGSGKMGELTWVSILITIFLLISGLMYFKRMELTFADVI